MLQGLQVKQLRLPNPLSQGLGNYIQGLGNYFQGLGNYFQGLGNYFTL